MKASYYNCDKTFNLGACYPREPKSGEVRIQVAYCGLCGTDVHVYHGNMDGRVGCERIIGHEMSGHSGRRCDRCARYRKRRQRGGTPTDTLQQLCCLPQGS